MDILLLIVKYTAAVLTGAYGVYATLTDFKEDKNGKKTLSQKGRIGILLLIIATVLSLLSDSLKDYRDDVQRRKDDARRDEMILAQQDANNKLSQELKQTKEINAELDAAAHDIQQTSNAVKQNSTTTKRVLQEAMGLADPFITERFEASLLFDVENSDAVKSYLQRTRSLGINKFYRGDTGFPSDRYLTESALVELSKHPEITLKIFAKEAIGKEVVDRDQLYLAMGGSCAGFSTGMEQNRGFLFNARFSTNHLELICYDELHPNWNANKVRSVGALAGNQVFVTFGDLDKEVAKVNLRWLVLSNSRGRRLNFYGFEREKDCNCFSHTIRNPDLLP